jgi:hypothetical protein
METACTNKKKDTEVGGVSTRLLDIKIEHVAGVDRPANKRSFLIIKQEKVIEKQMSISKEGDKFCLYDGDTKKGEYDSMEAAQAAKEKMMKGTSTMLTKEQIAAIKDVKVQEAAIAQQEEMLALEKKVETLEVSVAKGGAAPVDSKSDEIWKGVPAAIRNRFDAMEKERDEWVNKAKEEKDRHDTHAWIEKCRKFQYLQITPEHFGKVMKSVAEHDQTDAEEIERILERADDVIGKGTVFAELGRRNNGSNAHPADATNITARVENLAEDFMKLDKNLSKPDAITKVFNEHPDWHRAWRQEQTSRV